MNNCIFCKMINGEISVNTIYSDDDMIIIKDINPQACLHYLAIPKEHFVSVVDMTARQAEILGRMLKKIGELAETLGLRGGFRLVSNKGADGCQSVMHLHIHILGGEKLSEKMA